MNYKTNIKNVDIKYHYINNEVVFIDFFFVPAHLQGSGLGRKAYNLFEKTLPLEVKEVRLMAASGENGRVSEFWTKLGFDFLFDIKEECFEEEIIYSMTKPINGGTKKVFIYRETYENDVDVF